jgi:hypothetical protein
MRIALSFSPWLLAHRPTGIDFSCVYTDERGTTGSEYGLARIAEELVKLGHEVEIFTRSPSTEWHGMRIRPWEERNYVDRSYDAAISFNIPDDLRVTCARFQMTIFWLNNFSFCQPGFDQCNDLFVSPSNAHREMAIHRWKTLQNGQRYDARPEQWDWAPLGVDPEKYGHQAKIPGRVIYCSSPDRGLHHLLNEWPAIKAAVPHASLHIFYRLMPWVEDMLKVPADHEGMRENRRRALLIAEGLEKTKGMDVTIRDAVSREQIQIEQDQAEVMAYPCDTMIWSEGWSCSTHEGCMAQACPVITDCDAFGEVYGGVLPMVSRSAPDWPEQWRNLVILALRDADYRNAINETAKAWAETRTWTNTARIFEQFVRDGIARKEKA